MAYGTGADRSAVTSSRTVQYGYGLDDIQRASDNLQRNNTLSRFNLGKKFQANRRSLPGNFNQRGMIDSGQRRRAEEMVAAEELMQRYSLAAQTSEAEEQLARQRVMLEEQLFGGLMDDETGDALRRFGVAQTIQGLI
tara:strand:+ start:39 stop:452 length:414 start_codon:yes stop_codon:yes gene_type:complete